MKSLNKYINEYKKQIEKGDILIAYRGLMKYILDLKNYLHNKYPDHFISGSPYLGQMDITFFYFTTVALKKKKLKTAIVFNHEKISFEAWLLGANKQVHAKYLPLFREEDWNKYDIQSTSLDSLLEYVITDKPNFDEQKALTKQIESGVMKFIDDIVNFID